MQYSISDGITFGLNSDALQKENDFSVSFVFTSEISLLLPTPGSPTIQTKFSLNKSSIDKKLSLSNKDGVLLSFFSSSSIFEYLVI